MVDFADSPPGEGLLGRNWGWFMLRGVLAVLLGVLIILYPIGATFTVAAIFAAFAFIDGIMLLISGMQGARAKQDRWVSLVLSGLVGIAIGVIFVVWPGLSTASFALFTVLMVAVWAIITGALQLAAAVRLRKAIQGEWLLGIVGALSIALGIGAFVYAMVFPGVSIIAVGWMIGYYALLAGFSLIALAFRLRRLNHGLAAA